MKNGLVLFIVCVFCVNGYGQIGFEEHVIIDGAFATDGVHSVYATDIDGGGDKDMLFAAEIDNKIAWYENTDGLGSFGVQQIISLNAVGTRSVYASDIDGDGDIDALSASNLDNKVAWYENIGIVSLDNYSPTTFSIYPIPTKDVLFIQSKTSITKIEIYDSLGQQVFANSNANEINISPLSKGLYFCKIWTEDGDAGIAKVVKE